MAGPRSRSLSYVADKAGKGCSVGVRPLGWQRRAVFGARYMPALEPQLASATGSLTKRGFRFAWMRIGT